MKDVKKTERGWAGHYCCAESCMFRRNTLLECGDKRIVVSTVGVCRPNNGKPEPIGADNRMYETMVFPASLQDGYWDADCHAGSINFDSEWAIADVGGDSDQRANDMHEKVVAEFFEKLSKGEL